MSFLQALSCRNRFVKCKYYKTYIYNRAGFLSLIVPQLPGDLYGFRDLYDILQSYDLSVDGYGFGLHSMMEYIYIQR